MDSDWSRVGRAERFGQHADAGLVERAGHAGERVGCVFVGGEEEGVGGGAEGKVRRAVRMLEVKLVRGTDRAVVAGLGRSADEAPVWPSSCERS